MAHPHRCFLTLAEPLKQPAALDPNAGPAVLPPVGAGDVASAEVGEDLHAVAESEHRRAQDQELRIGDRHRVVVHGVGATREDDPLGIPLADPLHGARRRMDLAVHVGLTHPTCDELGVLGAEVDDEDAVLVLGHSQSSPIRMSMSNYLAFSTATLAPSETDPPRIPAASPPTTALRRPSLRPAVPGCCSSRP